MHKELSKIRVSIMCFQVEYVELSRLTDPRRLPQLALKVPYIKLRIKHFRLFVIYLYVNRK